MIVSATSVSRVFEMAAGPVTAVRDVTLSIASRDHVAIKGPSGCGKSTLLHMLGCVDTPSSGTLLFDGRDEANADVAAQAKSYYAQIAANRKLLTAPADAAESSKLVGHYRNDALGDIHVRREGGRTVFDFGEFRGEVASRKNPDGSISFIPITPGIPGFEFVVSEGGKRLTTRAAQHEYVFTGDLTP